VGRTVIAVAEADGFGADAAAVRGRLDSLDSSGITAPEAAAP
jgi:hypothetical protein